MGEMADYTLDIAFDPVYVEETDTEYDDGVYFLPVMDTKPWGPGPCPKCDGPTKVCTGRFGTFYGCLKYPKCKGSRNWCPK